MTETTETTTAPIWIAVKWKTEATATFATTVNIADVFSDEDVARVLAERDAGGDAVRMLRDLIEDGETLEDALVEDEGECETDYSCDERYVDTWSITEAPAEVEPDAPAEVPEVEPPTPAERGLALLKAHDPRLVDAEIGGGHFGDGSLGIETLTDVIADLFHLAWADGIHPETIARSALNDWFEEAADTDDDEDDEATPDTNDAAVEDAVCRHCTRPIARRTDREWPTHWVHNDERGGCGCADGITEADPVPTGECSWFAQCHDAATDYRDHSVLGRVPVCPTHLAWKP